MGDPSDSSQGSGGLPRLRWLVAPSLITAFLLVTGIIGGLAPGKALLIALVVAVQSMLGLLIYRWLAPVRANLIESIGFSLALGLTLSTLIALSANIVGLRGFGLLAPGCLAAIVMTAMGDRLGDAGRMRRQELLGLGSTLVIGLVGIAAFWRANPLDWQGWWAHYSDIYWHEAFANSFATFGLDRATWLKGPGISYHWLADAWAGSTTLASSAPAFAVLTRTLVGVVLLAGACLAWSWAKRWSSAPAAPALAAGLLMIAGVLGAGLTNTHPVLLGLFSPTHTYAAMMLLALSASFALVGETAIGKLSLVVAVLALGAGVSRTTLLPLALGGLALVIIYRWRARDALRSGLVVSVVAFLGITAGALAAMRPWSDSPKRADFALQWNVVYAEMLGFLPETSFRGSLLALAAVVLAVGAGGAGVLWLVLRCEWSPSLFWVIGATCAAIVSTFIFRQEGYSQITFIWEGIVLLVVASGVGVGEALAWLRQRVQPPTFTTLVGGLVVIGVCLGGLGLWISINSPGRAFEGLIRWSVPVGTWGLALMIGLLFATFMHLRPKRLLVLAVMCLVLVFGSVGTGVAAAVGKFGQPIGPFSQDSVLAMSREQLEAGRWVKDNVPEQALFTTNRFCDDPSLTPPDCRSTYFVYVTPLAGRQTLVEGYYMAMLRPISPATEETQWLIDRVVPSWSFAKSPSRAGAQALVDQGVEWMWIDRHVTLDVDFAPYARVAFENADVRILQFTPPSSWQ